MIMYISLKKLIQKVFLKNTLTGKTINLLEAKACWWQRRGIAKPSFTNLKKEDVLINGDFNLTSLINGDTSLINSEVHSLTHFIYHQVYHNCKINIWTPFF
nr:hypothetical protein BACY1_00330 [Tenacibaculum mesophilum]